MKTLLIVEDEPSIREMYRVKFTASDFKVLTANNGKEGFIACEKNIPDVVLLDLKMPVMSGEDMLKKLRGTDWGAAIKVIVLTNISRDEASQELHLLGVDRYIVKAHYTPAQVLDVVDDVLGLSRK